MNSDIRDQAYQFFLEEAPELLQTIETGILKLRQSRDTATVHSIMRSAHSLKGGAASVGLDPIKLIAHRLETIFKALYSERLEIDIDLENRLLEAFDCLRLPLAEQLTQGHFDQEQALAVAEPVLANLEAYCQEAILETENFIPGSADLGTNMAVSIFEVDVQQGLERLSAVLAQPQNYEVAGELRAQAEVFYGFAELLNLPGFARIAQLVMQAIAANPQRTIEIAQFALQDFQAGRDAVLSGDMTEGGSPSAALLALSEPLSPDSTPLPLVEPPSTATHPQPMAALLAALGEDPDALQLLSQLDLDFSAGELGDLAQGDLEQGDLALGDSALTEAHPPLEPATPEQMASQLEDFFGSLETAMTSLSDDLDGSLGDDLGDDLDDDLSGSLGDDLSDIYHDSLGDKLSENLNDGLSSIKGDSLIDGLIESISYSNSDHFDGIGDDIIDISAQISPVSLQETPAVLIEQAIPIDQAIQDRQLASAPVSNLLSNQGSEAEQVPNQISEQVPNQISEQATGKRPSPPDISIQPRHRSTGIDLTKPSLMAGLTVRVDADRLARMNNVLGELTINRNGLVLQQEQMQAAIQELLNRFERFQSTMEQLRAASEHLSVVPQRGMLRTTYPTSGWPPQSLLDSTGQTPKETSTVGFDSLEMDSYTTFYSHTQTLLEEMVQLEEAMGDIALFNRQSEQMLEQHRKMLSQMQDDLRWARMLPLGEVLNRFPRVLRDLSISYQKPVDLTLKGTELLVDKAVLEKLYDPLLHLLRNSFDHGIELSDSRTAQGKPAEGQIHIQAYYKGRQIVIEVRDDGRGLDLNRIRQRVIELEWLSLEETTRVTDAELAEFIFEPGFSTAAEVSELSGRGMGLDVVREQLQALKGTIAVQSTFGQGTTFRLTLPLTLTIANLLVCLVGATPIALLSNSITEIIIPKPTAITQTGSQRFVEWQNHQVPTYRLSELLTYFCLVPEIPPSRVLAAVPSPSNWETPMLILKRGQDVFALQVDRLVTEQELVIKPFGAALTSPGYAYGCTVLGDGSLVPVIDGFAFLDALLSQHNLPTASEADALTAVISENAALQQQSSRQVSQATTVLVVDDAVTSRRMLAASLGRVGYRVLQARDGQEALEQLQQGQSVQLIVCDIEMPNMNGFEFLTQRRQVPEFAQIPTIMLTSRSNDKHRWLAMQLGATAYFTKPYLEQEFMTAIAEYIQVNASS